MDVDFTLEDEVEMVSGFIFPEDDCPVGRDAFTTVSGEPVILVLSKVLKAFDAAQRRHNVGYRRRMRRRGRTYVAASLGGGCRISSVGLIGKCRSHVLSYSVRESPS
jgi:hypothetical protein